VSAMEDDLGGEAAGGGVRGGGGGGGERGERGEGVGVGVEVGGGGGCASKSHCNISRFPPKTALSNMRE
jgi:hypothetical protein